MSIYGQDDAYIELWNTAIQAGKVAHGTVQHLLSACYVKAQIAPAAIPELLLKMNAAVLAVGVRKEMNHLSSGDIAQARHHLIEGSPTVGVASQEMNTAGGTDDVFVAELPALHADASNFHFDEFIEPVVITRQNRVCDFIWLQRLHLLTPRLGLVGTRKQKFDLATAVSLGDSPSVD